MVNLPHGPDSPMLVILDPDARIEARVWLQKLPDRGGRVMLAVHDPARSEQPGEDEVYALALESRRALMLGTALVRLSEELETRSWVAAAERLR